MDALKAWKIAHTTKVLTATQRRALRCWEKTEGVCGICFHPIPHPLNEPEKMNRKNALTVDHITPVSQGGKNFPENIRPAHSHCNNCRGTNTKTAVEDPNLMKLILKKFNPGVV